MTLSLSFNDYGFHLCSTSKREFSEEDWKKLLSPDKGGRAIARLYEPERNGQETVPGSRPGGRTHLSGLPRCKKSNRQVQASGGLFFDVFSKYDPNNLLLTQSRREVLDRQLEVNRMVSTLQRITEQKFVRTSPVRLSPFGFPLWAESLRSQVSSESWSERVQRMAMELEKKSSQ